jgi:hypothetical protein
VCRRCGIEKDTTHQWKDVERAEPCVRKEVCEKCGREREQPDHDWTPGTSATGETSLSCSRCGLSI